MAHRADAADEDLQDQALVLDRLPAHNPTHMQVSDLQRELQLGEDEFDRRDRVDQAITQLKWAGLALCCGSAFMPTRAALHYRLLSDETTVDL